jgi:hypothetical protein
MLETFGRSDGKYRVLIPDTSRGDSAGKTGLLFNSTGLEIQTIADTESSFTSYTAAGSTIETISVLGTYSEPTATKCRFREIGYGEYEIQLAAARFSVASAQYLDVIIPAIAALSTAQVTFRIELKRLDLNETNGRVDIGKIGGSAQSLADFKDLADTGYNPDTHKIASDAAISDQDIANALKKAPAAGAPEAGSAMDRLDAKISSRGTGDATAASQTTIINALTAIASAIGAIPAAVWTYLSDQGNRVVTNLIAFFQNAGAATSNKVDNVTVIQEQQAGARTVTITVETADGDPIPDAEIQLMTTGGVPAGSRGRTNALGQFAASVDDGNYIITGHKYFVTFTNAAITVDATHLSFDFTGVEWSPTQPAGADIQTVWDYARNGKGLAQPGATITAKVLNASAITDSIVLLNKVSDLADAQGYWELPLIKGVRYSIDVEYGPVRSLSKEITITNDSTKQLRTY